MALMVFYIVPKFNAFLQDFGAELPLITKLLVGFAITLQGNWQVLLFVLLSSIVAFVLWQKSGVGRIAFDRLKLKFPIVGPVAHDYAQNRFTRTLGTLLSGGIPLVTALELAARAVGNAHFEQELLSAAVKVREGQSLWESLEKTGLISDIAIEMIKVGESTGSLVEMLDNTSEFTEEEIDHKLTKMVTLIEPLMLVFLALVVAGMLLAIYLPLLQVAGGQATGL
jgi:type IV pilus assembly protein PilC